MLQRRMSFRCCWRYRRYDAEGNNGRDQDGRGLCLFPIRMSTTKRRELLPLMKDQAFPVLKSEIFSAAHLTFLAGFRRKRRSVRHQFPVFRSIAQASVRHRCHFSLTRVVSTLACTRRSPPPAITSRFHYFSRIARRGSTFSFSFSFHSRAIWLRRVESNIRPCRSSTWFEFFLCCGPRGQKRRHAPSPCELLEAEDLFVIVCILYILRSLGR